MAFPVIVKIKYPNEPIYRTRLKTLELEKSGAEEYRGLLTEKQIKQLSFLQKRGVLTYYIDNKFGLRGGSYRNIFFRNYKPAIGDIYFCAYCGRPLSRKSITIDHIYPVGRVRKSASLQRTLERKGISSVNDPLNLAPACSRCNQRKSDKMGLWVIKGRFGRSQRLWLIRHIIRILIIISIGMGFYTGRLSTNYIRNILLTAIEYAENIVV